MILRGVFVTLLMGAIASCGYTLRTSKNRSLEKKGIHTIYLAPVENSTIKAGIENVVYNQMLQRLLIQSNVRVVKNKDQADAVIEGTVYRATMANGPVVNTKEIVPLTSADNRESLPVISQYNASLGVAFELKQKGTRIWRGKFSESKPFRSTVALGIQGVTTSLIDESTFDQALLDLADEMAEDAHEAMFSDF